MHLIKLTFHRSAHDICNMYIDEVLYMYCVTTTTVSDKGFTFINNVL